MRGVKTLGYEPTPADLELLRKERESRQVNRIEPGAPTQGDSQRQPSKASARGSGGRKAVLAALEAVLVAKRVPEKQRDAIMAAAREKLAQRIARRRRRTRSRSTTRRAVAAPGRRADAPRSSARASVRRRHAARIERRCTVELERPSSSSLPGTCGLPIAASGSRRTPGFAEAFAAAHADRQRPRCLCLPEGVEMYVARLRRRLHRQAHAVHRQPARARLPVVRAAARAVRARAGARHGDHRGPGHRRDDAEAGVRAVEDAGALGACRTTGAAIDSVATRRHEAVAARAAALPVGPGRADALATGLRGQAHRGARCASTCCRPPRTRSRAATLAASRGSTSPSRSRSSSARRSTHAASRSGAAAVAVPGKPQQLMLLIAEVKEIVPARYGFKAVIKHVPDQAFAIDEQLYRRLGRRFEAELTLWGVGRRHPHGHDRDLRGERGRRSDDRRAVADAGDAAVAAGRGRVREAARGAARGGGTVLRQGASLQPRAGNGSHAPRSPTARDRRRCCSSFPQASTTLVSM